MSLGGKTKVQVLVDENWCPQGQMYVVNAEEIRIGYDLGAPFLDPEGPAKIVVCHDERDAFRVREAVRDSDGMELYEDD